jgi:uncharacterized protein with beta-barrel porin domain
MASTVAGAIHNAADLDISSAYTVPTPFINTGGIFVTGAGSISGNIYDATILSIGQNSQGVSGPTNFTTGGTIGGVPTIHVYNGSSFQSNNVISGIAVDLTVNSGANAVFNSLVLGSGVLNNNGSVVFGVNSNIRLAAGINNSGAIDIYGSFTLPSSFVNSGTVNLVGNAATIVGDILFTGTLGIVSKDYIFNNVISGPELINIAADASFRIPAASTFTLNTRISGAGILVNNGTLNITRNGKLDNIIVSGNGTIVVNPDVVIAIAHDLNTAGQSWVNRGTSNIYGNRTVTAAAYAAPGIQNFTITSPSVYDSLTSNAAVDLSGGTINITSKLKNCHDQNYKWDIISGAAITTDGNTTVNIPESSYFHEWKSSVSATALSVEYNHTAFTPETPEKHAKMAAALDHIMSHGSEADKQALTHTLAGCSCHSEYLEALDKLQPNLNMQPNHVAVQNATLNKAEMRAAGLRDATPHIPGIAYGDINHNTALWLAGFGSVANQKQTSSISGYRATAAGGLLGFDRKCRNGSIYGFALGYSNSNVDGALDTDFNTRIIGYHILGYGTNDINTNNFYEWLATGIVNTNDGSRQININNTNWNVTSSYNTQQAGFRFNLGQYIDFDGWRFSQVETARYTLLHQPGYNEVGSPAALHVETQDYSSILTFGIGYRLAWTGYNAWEIGSRELRALVTYDVITSDNVTTASFIAGGSDFTISNDASRLALQLGADYAFTFYDKLQLQLSYDFELRNQYTDNSVEVRFRYLF